MTFWPRLEVRKRDIQFIVDLCIKDLQDNVGMQFITPRIMDGTGRGGGVKGEMGEEEDSYLEGV